LEPEVLAKEIIKTLGDADRNTAHAALQIALLLFKHREYQAIDFTSDAARGEVQF
jgi:hypothetical protein